MQQHHQLPSGVPGFDGLSGGGLPAGRVTLLRGAPGCGKTVFSLQHLASGVREQGEPGLLFSFEERPRNIEQSLAGFGWAEVIGNGLEIVDARLLDDGDLSGDFDLVGLLALAARRIEQGTRRVVFDGFDSLLQLLGDGRLERVEVARLYRWIEDHEATCLITCRDTAGGSPQTVDRGQLLEFMADCIVDLEHRAEGLSAQRTLAISKYRGTSHFGGLRPALIDTDGMRVAALDPTALEYRASEQRIDSGVPRLDTMLGGGVHRGSSVLISGAPGTAKSTLAASWAATACAAGERALLVSFDEAPDQIRRNMRSVGIDLGPHIDAGRLRLVAARTGGIAAELHFDALRREVEALDPQLVVIDPLSALGRASSLDTARSVAQRLIDLLRGRGITAIITALVDDAVEEKTMIEISTVADTWIGLRFAQQAGERNRALTIVKSRGSAHSHQVRELRLSAQGPTLEDVYTAGGQVLMGTARLEREHELAMEAELRAAQREHEDLERAAEHRELEAKLRAIHERLEVMDRQARVVEAERRELDEESFAFRRRVHESRSGDADREDG